MEKNNIKILLVDPTSIHHGPPETVKATDDFINKEYVKRVNEEVNKRCSDNESKALSSKYISNYGLLMLGTLLKKDYNNVSYINGDYFKDSTHFINYIIDNCHNFDLISLTSTTPQFKEIRKIAMLIKEISPNTKVILGGPHSRYYLTHDVDDCFDSVCIGYGIDKSKEIIDNLISGKEVEKKVITDYYYDIAKDFSLIPKDRINDTMLYSYINFGCPNDCKYCVEHKFVNKMAFNDPNTKFDEIRKLVNEYNVKFIHIADSDFLIHRPTIEAFVKFVEQENLDFCFSINTSPIIIHKYLNDPIMYKLKDIGLIEVLIGAEHFSTSVLKNMAKVYNVNKFIDDLKYFKKDVKIPIISLYTLVGLPGEHKEDIKENIAVIKHMKEQQLFDFTFPKFMVPYPDSEVYLNPDKYDVTIKNENWEEYQRWQLPRPIAINGMSDQDYVDEIIEINRITMEGYKYENNSSASVRKKRR